MSNRSRLDTLVDVVVSDESMVEYILAKVKDSLPDAMNAPVGLCKRVIDSCVQETFTEMNIWEMVANAKREIAYTTHDEIEHDTPVMESSTESSVIPMPEFSTEEPIRVAEAPGRRHHDYNANEKKRVLAATKLSPSSSPSAALTAAADAVCPGGSKNSPARASPAVSSAIQANSTPNSTSKGKGKGKAVSPIGSPARSPKNLTNPPSRPDSSAKKLSSPHAGHLLSDNMGPVRMEALDGGAESEEEEEIEEDIEEEIQEEAEEEEGDNSFGAPEFTESPDIIESGLGIGKNALFNASTGPQRNQGSWGSGSPARGSSSHSSPTGSLIASSNASPAAAARTTASPSPAQSSGRKSALKHSPSSANKSGVSSSSPGALLSSNGFDKYFSPTAAANVSSPNCANHSHMSSATRSSGGGGGKRLISPGSNLEEDDFDDDQQNNSLHIAGTSPAGGSSPGLGGTSAAGGGLDFTKRYRFDGDFPETTSDNEADGEGVDMNAWLLAQSEGNPLESSMGSAVSRESPLRKTTPGASPSKGPGSPSRRTGPMGGASHSPSTKTSPQSNSKSLLGSSPLRTSGNPSPASNKSSPRYRYGNNNVRGSFDSNSDSFHETSSPSPSPGMQGHAQVAQVIITPLGSPSKSPSAGSRSFERNGNSVSMDKSVQSLAESLNESIATAMSSPGNNSGNFNGLNGSMGSPGARSPQSTRVLVRRGEGGGSPPKGVGSGSPVKSPAPLSSTGSPAPRNSNSPQHKLPGSPLQRSPPPQDIEDRNRDRPLMRTIRASQQSDSSLVNLNESIDEEGSLTGGAGVFEFESGNDGTYDGDEDFELNNEQEEKVPVGGEDGAFDDNMDNVDYGSDDGNVEGLAAPLSPDSFTRKYGSDTPPGSPSKINASMESRDNVAYGSDFEDDIAEDFDDDFEELDEGEDTQRRSVRFKPKPVSDVFITRDKYTADEVKELFYTHDEALQFSMDYSKETHRAEMAGRSWYDWWEARTEEQWEQDDAENEKLSAWSDDDEELETGQYSFDEEIEEGDDDGSNDFARF